MYPAHWVKWTFGGMFMADEEWNCSITMGSPGGSGAVPGSDADWWKYVDQNLTLAHNAFGTFFGTNGLPIPGSAYHDYTKGAVLNELGKYVGTRGPAQITRVPPLVLGHAGLLPAQCSLVISHFTDVARGPGHSGRIYLPVGTLSSSDITASGQFNISMTTLRDLYKTLLTTLNTGKLDGQLASPRVAVVSKVDGLPHTVKEIRIGNVIDTQRRRRNRIVETFVTAAIPAT